MNKYLIEARRDPLPDDKRIKDAFFWLNIVNRKFFINTSLGWVFVESKLIDEEKN